PPSQTADRARANIVEAIPSATAGQFVAVTAAAARWPKTSRIRTAMAGAWASSSIVQGVTVADGGGGGAAVITGGGGTGSGPGGRGGKGGGAGAAAPGTDRTARRRAAGTASEPK